MLPSTNTTPTISHVQLSELTGKRQDNVKRVIEKLSESGVIAFTQIEEVQNKGNNRGYKINTYQVNERDSYIVVAQLCPEYTAKLVDHWMATRNNQPQLPQTKREWIEFALEQERQLEIAAPKVEFHDTIVQSDNTYKYQEAGKKIQQRPNKFIAWLKEWHYIDKSNMPYQKYLTQELFKISSGVNKQGWDYTQGRVTNKGLAYFSKKLTGITL